MLSLQKDSIYGIFRKVVAGLLQNIIKYNYERSTYGTKLVFKRIIGRSVDKISMILIRFMCNFVHDKSNITGKHKDSVR